MSAGPDLTAALADRYRIERVLGQGGMATVHLAHDLRHDRKVALKVLRPELAAVLGAERFVQEIRTTANLQHPHILPLFDSGSANGQLYYVMPYVEGETLRQRLDRETQLGVEEAVRIAADVADALDHAHRHGVIHRDIKPENILLQDGRPLVADFGIALAVSAAAGGRLTETGLSLGTPHYMSPEQATADRDLTPRSDVYSLGAVLFEMLAGEPPHTGASAQAVVMKIIADTPRPVRELRQAVPPHVAAAVGRALERLPADRFPSARAFADALGNPAFGARVAPAPLEAIRHRWAPWGVAALAILAAGAAALRPRGGPDRPDAVLSATMELPSELVIAYPTLAFSPDGSRLFVVVRGEDGAVLFERRLEDFQGRGLPGTTGASMQFTSPDGHWIAFRRVCCPGLAKSPSEGGPAVVIDPEAIWAMGDWAPDGTLYYSRSHQSGIWRVDADGANPRPLTTPEPGELGHHAPRLLPNGQHLIYAVFRTPLDSSRIEAVSLRTGTRSILVNGGIYPSYVDGHLLFVRNEVLFAAAFDPERVRILGEARPVLENVAVSPEQGAAGYAVSSTGMLAFVPASEYHAPTDIVWVDRRGNASPALSLEGRHDEPALAPDGGRVAVTLTRDGVPDVWVVDLARGARTRITGGGGASFGPEWSPDGRSLLFVSEQPVFDLFLRPADAGRPARELLRTAYDKNGGIFTPDGRFVLFTHVMEQARHLARVPVEGGDPEVVLTSSGHVELPTLSPDGRWLAYTSSESGRPEVYLVSYPDVGVRRLAVSTEGGSDPRWTRGGRELVWRNRQDVVAAPVDPVTGDVGRPVVLFTGDYEYSRRRVRSWDAAPDGERFLLVRRAPEHAPRRVHVITNWVELLRRTMAAGPPR